jgi:membrane dipeptidase
VKWFDGHLDLAYLAETGRDLQREAADCGGEHQSASVTFPALSRGNVQGVLGTIFVQKREPETEAPRKGVAPHAEPWTFSTAQEAGHAARRQLEIYAHWESEGWIEIASKHKTSKTKHQTQKHETPAGREPIQVVILMEGASGVQRVEEMDDFYAAGVRMVSLTWAEGSVWSGGNNSPGDVTAAGRQLLARMDELGMIHDVSHLSEQAFWTVMATARGMKVASHSNCRALLPESKSPERHLSDEQIRALVAAGGIIGINLYASFLVADGTGRRATLADVVRHIAHMEKVAGRRDFLCLGSDMDGGFSREQLPVDMNGPEHLDRLAEALSAAGWSDAEIERFAWGNWARVLGSVGVQVE